MITKARSLGMKRMATLARCVRLGSFAPIVSMIWSSVGVTVIDLLQAARSPVLLT